MSCNEWKEYTLGELSINYNTKRKPLSSRERENRKGVYPYYGAQGIIDYIDDYMLEGKYLLIAEDGNNLKERKEDIVRIATGKFWVNNHAHIITNNEFSDMRFLKYYLNNLDISPYVTGSAQPKLNKANLSRLKIVAPSLEEQSKIADILSSLDDKIQLNNEMNKTLEEMAQSIFKRWFVDFEFPNEDGEPYKSSGGEMVDSALGMIPNGWEVKTLDDIGDIISGGTPSTKNEEYYGGYISWITPKDLSGYNRKFISKGERCITELGLQKSSAKLLPKGTVLFSSRAPIGYVAIAEKEVSTNQGFKSVVCNEEIMNNNYVYYFLKYNKENIENVSSGSTFKEISGTHMKNIKIIVPRKFILDKFNDIIESFDSLLKKNYEDMDVLEQIRDSLLPKLMTGDVNL